MTNSLKICAASVVFFTAAVLLAACSGETVESKYSKYRASFSLAPVNTIAPLNNAMSSYGDFCAIWADANYYYFKSLTSQTNVNRTALAAYKTYICIGGFIVGRASTTELGTADYPMLCYDRACPNCYHDDLIAHAMTLSNGGLAVCSRCHRTYDLNNEGVVVSGDKGRHLERYHIAYNGSSISIYN